MLSRVPFLIAALAWTSALAQEPASFAVSGEWDVLVFLAGTASQTVHVILPAMILVTAEKYTAIRIFDPEDDGWHEGVQLRGVKTMETTRPRSRSELRDVYGRFHPKGSSLASFALEGQFPADEALDVKGTEFSPGSTPHAGTGGRPSFSVASPAALI
jgi:hypothetical protein